MYNTTYYEYKIFTDALSFRQIKKELFFFSRNFWWETILTNFNFIESFDFILT